ncbi:hypothetical protein HY463_01650 [Candidatus Peregrinibacteria bacterium]|nr:hypothetical protein [Candidatus Peregrinibacteria bacterium]
MLITLYGVNNIGKSTQAKKLVERLEKAGKKAKYIKYPVYELEPTGVFLNKYLRGEIKDAISEEELQMWFTLNRYQFEPTLKKLLAEGYIVVAEDYTGTGIAWGSAKGADMAWLEGMNKFLIREDLAILLEGERFTAAVEAGHIHETNPDFIEKSRASHATLAEKYGWKRVRVVEGIDKTADLIWGIVVAH